MWRDLHSSKLRLPDLDGIEIGCFSNSDTKVNSFLSEFIPAQLNLLAINYPTSRDTSIKSKFYIKSFSKAEERTFKDIYFQCIDFSEKYLQTAIRSARNAKRIVFHFCCIHCSSELDFGADLSYNTEYISFQGWGDMSYYERTTDWIEEPTSFFRIVDAIASSGLRASLKKLSIKFNQTLSISRVQEELNGKGMSQISVVDEVLYPPS